MAVRRFALAGGWTAGHVYPGLAIAEAFRDLGACETVFIGAPGGFEMPLDGADGVRVEIVNGGPLFGIGGFRKAASLARLAEGALQARRILAASGARLVIGVGGYASAAPLLGAKSLGLPTVIVEANVAAGLTNRLFAPFADRIFLGADARLNIPSDRTARTGLPVRRSIVEAADRVRRAPRESSRPFRIFVTGGSLGSAFLNQHVPSLCRRLAEDGVRLEVLHQSGDLASEDVRRAYRRSSTTARVLPFVHDMADAYRSADFVIARAGAGTIAELAISGVPALLVPLSGAAREHQVANADAYARSGACRWVCEESWREAEVAAELAGILRDPRAWSRGAAAARACARPQAAQEIVACCEELMHSRW